MDEDSQETLVAMAEETAAARSIRDESKNMNDSDPDKEGEDLRRLVAAVDKVQGVRVNRQLYSCGFFRYIDLLSAHDPSYPPMSKFSS